MTLTPSGRRDRRSESCATVMLVDPHAVSRRGLAAVIAREEDLELVVGAGSVAEAHRRAGVPRVDLVVVEPLAEPRRPARLISALAEIAPGAAIVALSANDESRFVATVRTAGVDAFLSKELPINDVLSSIRRVLVGRDVRAPMEETPPMTKDHMYKKIEVIGSSTEGIEDAVEQALARTSKTVRQIRWFEVVDVRGHVDDAEVAHWQVTVKIGFTLDET